MQLGTTARMLACSLLAAAALSAHAATTIVVRSPDESVTATISGDDSRITLAIEHAERVVLEQSPLGVLVDGVRLTEGASLVKSERYQVDETYPWRGAHSTAVNRCRGTKISVSHAASGTAWTLEVRVYDDGVAYRYEIPAEDDDQQRVPDEDTMLNLPVGATAWFHDLEGHYESPHEPYAVDELEEGAWAAPPMTYQLREGGGYAAVTEAALTNFSGMALQAAGDSRFRVALGHSHPPSYPFRLRYEDDVERMQQPAAVEGTILSPWRAIIIADDLNGLINSDLVHNLCPPPDAELFPDGMNTAWIKPGRAVWRYLDGGDNSLEEVNNFSRWAGELGFEYQVVEGFWRRWDVEEVRKAVEYAREQGVGLWFWRHSRELRTPEARTEFFHSLREWGIVGAKIDFFDHEHKEVVDLYAPLLEEAARHQIMVNFHGANKPTGEARTWPNELTREAVKGMEARRLANRARHDATLPFTRYLAGPGDYTPVVFGERRGDTTAAHQIATAAMFDEPLLTYGAYPRTLLEHPAVEMIKSIPAVWDETIVLEPSAIGELALMARRRRDDWFLVALNGPDQHELTVPLHFLGDGEYAALQVRDVAGEPTQVELEQTTVGAEDTLAIELDSGGGFIARFSQR
jgi:alpha-glucosidase